MPKAPDSDVMEMVDHGKSIMIGLLILINNETRRTFYIEQQGNVRKRKAGSGVFNVNIVAAST